MPVRSVAGSDFTVPPGATATRWIDGLHAADADVLVEYVHPHFARWPAVTTREHGRGRVTYVGTVPDLALGAALGRWLARDVDSAWRPTAAAQTVTGATARDGARLRIVHNWSFTPSEFVVPVAASDLLSPASFAAGNRLTLGPWDVRVLVEDPTTP